MSESKSEAKAGTWHDWDIIWSRESPNLVKCFARKGPIVTGVTRINLYYVTENSIVKHKNDAEEFARQQAMAYDNAVERHNKMLEILGL